MTEFVPDGGVGLEEDFDGFVGELELVDKVSKKGEGCKCIVEGIVPLAGGGEVLEIGEAEGLAEVAEAVGFFAGPGGAGELEGVDPRAEGVPGEGAEESFFGAVAVGDDGSLGEGLLEGRPEGEERGGVGEVGGGDAVDFLGGPGDGLVALKEGDEGGGVGV